MKVIEHLLRLEAVIRLYSFTDKNIKFLKKLQKLNTKLIKIYSLSVSPSVKFYISDTTTISDPKSLAGLLEKSVEFIDNNRNNLDTKLINKIISNIKLFIYTLKHEY